MVSSLLTFLSFFEFLFLPTVFASVFVTFYVFLIVQYFMSLSSLSHISCYWWSVCSLHSFPSCWSFLHSVSLSQCMSRCISSSSSSVVWYVVLSVVLNYQYDSSFIHYFHFIYELFIILINY